MRIKSIGLAYLKLGEKHGRSVALGEITVWKDTEVNIRKARVLETKKLIKILEDEPPSVPVSVVPSKPPASVNSESGKTAIEESEENVTSLPARPAVGSPGFNFGAR